MANPETAILVQNVKKIYRSKPPVTALDGLSLEVKKGEIHGLLGRNGAGKTTLLRILTTLILPSSGSASVLGFDVEKKPLEVRRRICTVLQENAVEVYLSVTDNLETYARFHAIPSREIRPRVEVALDRFALGEVRHQKVIDLSGGMKRRIQVAKVFMVDKPVVFLDEATTGMDPINKRTTLDAIRDQARLGRTFFLTTHLLQEAEELCDAITIVDQGKSIASGDLETIRSLSSRAFDMTITFEEITDDLLEDLRSLPLLTMTYKHRTVELCVAGAELTALDIVKRLSERHAVKDFEVTRATLEDVFLQLLGARDARSRGRGEGTP